MNSTGLRRYITLISALALVCTLIGCSDDDNPGPIPNDLVGSWVAYQGLTNGSPDPNGGTSGEAGACFTLNADQTATSWDITDPESELHYTWSASDGVMTAVSEEFGTQTVDYELSGDLLSFIYDDGEDTYSTLLKRHVGAAVLLATWEFVSMFDDYHSDLIDVPAHTLRFAAGSIATFTEEGESPINMSYSTDGYLASIGTWGDFIFTVVGTQLYLIQYVPGENEWEEQLTIMTYHRQ